MAKKVTMQDIADKLNISKNSVSQALSGKGGVSEETRRRVKQVAEQLGYKYSNNRRQKGNERKRNIALIASDYAFSLKSFFGEIYLSIEAEVHNQGMNLLIQSINKELVDQLALPPLFETHPIDGILILSHITTEYINKVIATGIPTVIIDHHHPHIKADAVLTNNRFGAYTAVEHLLQLSHRRIAFVGNIDFSPSYYERLEGYLMALRDYGVKPDEALIFSNAREEEEMIDQFIKSLPEQPTAWFCVNDGLGYLVNACLQQNGIKVPEEASVCSFDNGQLSRIATPKITTMDIDLQYFGQKAVEQLCWRMAHRDAPIQEILLPTKLIVRQSTANAPE